MAVPRRVRHRRPDQCPRPHRSLRPPNVRGNRPGRALAAAWASGACPAAGIEDRDHVDRAVPAADRSATGAGHGWQRRADHRSSVSGAPRRVEPRSPRRRSLRLGPSGGADAAVVGIGTALLVWPTIRSWRRCAAGHEAGAGRGTGSKPGSTAPTCWQCRPKQPRAVTSPPATPILLERAGSAARSPETSIRARPSPSPDPVPAPEGPGADRTDSFLPNSRGRCREFGAGSVPGVQPAGRAGVTQGEHHGQVPVAQALPRRTGGRQRRPDGPVDARRGRGAHPVHERLRRSARGHRRVHRRAGAVARRRVGPLRRRGPPAGDRRPVRRDEGPDRRVDGDRRRQLRAGDRARR